MYNKNNGAFISFDLVIPLLEKYPKVVIQMEESHLYKDIYGSMFIIGENRKWPKCSVSGND